MSHVDKRQHIKNSSKKQLGRYESCLALASTDIGIKPRLGTIELQMIFPCIGLMRGMKNTKNEYDKVVTQG